MRKDSPIDPLSKKFRRGGAWLFEVSSSKEDLSLALFFRERGEEGFAFFCKKFLGQNSLKSLGSAERGARGP